MREMQSQWGWARPPGAAVLNDGQIGCIDIIAILLSERLGDEQMSDKYIIDRIETEYDPDHDLNEHESLVSWTEKQLLRLIVDMKNELETALNKIEVLEIKVSELKRSNQEIITNQNGLVEYVRSKIRGVQNSTKVLDQIIRYQNDLIKDITAKITAQKEPK